MCDLIGIHGLKRSGKGVVSNHLTEKYGYKHEKFSQPLKNMLLELLSSVLSLDKEKDKDLLFRLIEDDLKEMPLVELYGKSPRFIMQTLYKEWSLLLRVDMWHIIFDNVILKNRKNGFKTVVDDVRCFSGLNKIKQHNGILWIIERPHNTNLNKIQQHDIVFKNTHLINQNDLKKMLTIFYSYFSTPNKDNLIVELGFTKKQIEDTFFNYWFPLLKEDKQYISSNHISEKLMDKSLFDDILINNSDINTLHNQITTIIKKY